MLPDLVAGLAARLQAEFQGHVAVDRRPDGQFMARYNRRANWLTGWQDVGLYASEQAAWRAARKFAARDDHPIKSVGAAGSRPTFKTLPAGMPLFHGTARKNDFVYPRAPAWFTDSLKVAKEFAKGARTKTLVYRVVTPLKLLSFPQYQELFDWINARLGATYEDPGFVDYTYDASDYVYNKTDYHGWILTDAYPGGSLNYSPALDPEGTTASDIMLCEPARFLEPVVPTKRRAEGEALIKAEGEDPIDVSTPAGVLLAVQYADDGYLDETELASLEAALAKYPPLTFRFLGKTLDNARFVGDQIVEYEDGSFKAYSREDWMRSSEAEGLIEEIAEKIEERLNQDFQEAPGKLWHATDSANVDLILSEGLRAQNRSRGLTNRSVGASIFTVDDRAAVNDAYGDTVLEIDLAAMKRDGLQYAVAQEPAVEEAEAAGALAAALDIDDYSRDGSGDGADDPSTIILYVAVVPPKYLKVVDAGR